MARRHAEADLGVFSMFGRTGPPQKGGPTKGQIFSFFCNMVTSQKYCNNDYGIKETILCGAAGAPHFF